jgi:hypothetical protein
MLNDEPEQRTAGGVQFIIHPSAFIILFFSVFSLPPWCISLFGVLSC